MRCGIVMAYGNLMRLDVMVNGVNTAITNSSATTAQGVWYDVCVVADWQNVTVYRAQRGTEAEMAQVLTASTASITTTARLEFAIGTDSYFKFDDIMAISDNLFSTTTYAYNAGNELTTVTRDGTAQSMTYDAWGRLSTRTQGSYATTYEYRFGDKLRRGATNFPGDAPETRFVYDGFGHRRGMGDGTNYLKWWRWDSGWNVMSEHADDGNNAWGIGTQTRAYVNTAEVIGADTATGAYRYRILDHLGSTRALYDANKASLGHYEYTPYGEPWLHTGAQTDKLYTGHAWTDRINLYYAPYRWLDPANARWTSRDPLGMVDGPNMFGYTGGSPINRVDRGGGDWTIETFFNHYEHGEGRSVNLAMVGLLDDYQNSADVKEFVANFKFYTKSRAQSKAKELLGLCHDCQTEMSGTFTYGMSHLVDMG